MSRHIAGGTAVSAPTGRRIFILRDPHRCSGCRLCEVACSLHHEDTVFPEASRIRVIELIPGIDVPHLCAKCPDYPCLKACQREGYNAIRVDEATGAPIVDADKCTGCGACIRACPGKVPRLHPVTRKALICDLCGGDPACVKACRDAGYNALIAVPETDRDLFELYSVMPQFLVERLKETYYGEHGGEM